MKTTLRKELDQMREPWNSECDTISLDDIRWNALANVLQGIMEVSDPNCFDVEFETLDKPPEPVVKS